MVLNFLKNKGLFTDLNKSSGFIDIDGIKVAGISNTNQLMPYLYSIFSNEELDNLFIHQRTKKDVILSFNKEDIISYNDPENDFN